MGARPVKVALLVFFLGSCATLRLDQQHESIRTGTPTAIAVCWGQLCQAEDRFLWVFSGPFSEGMAAFPASALASLSITRFDAGALGVRALVPSGVGVATTIYDATVNGNEVKGTLKTDDLNAKVPWSGTIVPFVIEVCAGEGPCGPGSGSLWTIDGASGEANSDGGDVGDLQVESFGPTNVNIQVIGKPGTRLEGLLQEPYRGTRRGNKLQGTAIWSGRNLPARPPASWQAAIPGTLKEQARFIDAHVLANDAGATVRV